MKNLAMSLLMLLLAGTAGAQVPAIGPGQAQDAELAAMQRLASGARGAFRSPNRDGVSVTGIPGDLAFAARRSLGSLTANMSDAQSLYNLGWNAASSPIGQPRANCGELAAFVHAFIIWDRTQNRGQALGGQVARWRVVMRGDMDHAQNIVETASGRRFVIDAWRGTAEPIETDASLQPAASILNIRGGSPVFHFR
ncbi:MAG: hypothetical protein HYZ75_16150 [Elusimicrobia bacterium]|nr:hypothetical protein [Elusimicrobiota bacterium]